MTTLRELADEVNMTPTELREWFPWSFDPATPDDVEVPTETAWEVRVYVGHTLTAYVG